MPRNWRRPWIEAFHIAMHVLAHLATVMVLIFVISLVKTAVRKAGDPLLLDFVPVRYIFDAMDLGLLVQFLGFGLRAAYNAFKEDIEND